MTSSSASYRVSVAAISQPSVVPADLSDPTIALVPTAGRCFEEQICVADWDAIAEWSFAL